jgi:hypothetical protein
MRYTRKCLILAKTWLTKRNCWWFESHDGYITASN